MNFSKQRKKDTILITINGELDHHTAEEMRQSLDEVLEDTSIKHLIFDLNNLKFMDSSGIGVLIGRYKIIATRGGKIAIVNPNSRISKIMEVSGLYKLMSLHGSAQGALEYVRGVENEN